ncbi:GIY-YIG nuclease family protein [Microbacterium sp. JZ101]
MTTLADPCAFCGGREGERVGGWPRCARCGWIVGDAPDADLAPPRVEVVYYLRYAERVKIGTSTDPRRRLRTIRHEELLAFEQGGRPVEQARHAQFAHLREGGEWFTAAPELLAHIASLADGDPWHRYLRWLADAHRP